LAFSETETTVSREHACIRYDREAGVYRIFDTHSQRGTFVLRGGRRIDVPRGGAAGVQLKSGDEIHLGNARVRFETQES
jgi:pSer/pThr/pTyr-binding forkhead associated (FHA) protein